MTLPATRCSRRCRTGFTPRHSGCTFGAMDKGDWNEEVMSMTEEIDELSELIRTGNTRDLGAVRRKRITGHFERLSQKYFNHSI
jgi:hypothetical protein